MELTKTKYKQTEVGLIPEDWEIKKVDDLCNVMGRVGWKGYTKKDLVAIGPYAIGAKHIDKNNKLNLSDPTCLSREKYLESPEIFVFEGDLLIVQRGTIGKLVLINENIGDATINPSMLIIRSRNNISDFMYHYLLSRSGQNQILCDTSSTGVPMITQKQVKSFQIPLPPTHTEQKAIASALSDVDALISSLEKLITKKKVIKQGAMQELLTPPHKGGKRLAGFSGEWEEKGLGKIGQSYGGLTGKSKKDFDNGTHPYITFLNVMNNTVIDPMIFEYVHIRLGEQQNKARKGDLFFNTSSETPEQVGMCSLLNTEIESLYLNSFCFGFRLKEDCGVDGLFLSYLMNSSIGRNLFLSLAQGATRYNLSKHNFNKLEITVPKPEEQKAIAQILSDMDGELEALETKKEKYQQIKQGMMQELLTGKTRLV